MLFYHMISEQDVIKLKTAIVLNEMLKEAQSVGNKNARINDRKIEIVNSFGKLSAETGITKSNLLSMFSGKTGTKITSLLPVLSAFNRSIIDFAKRYEKITDSDIQKFKELRSPNAPTNKNTKRKAIK
jgi:hypothetical protein